MWSHFSYGVNKKISQNVGISNNPPFRKEKVWQAGHQIIFDNLFRTMILTMRNVKGKIISVGMKRSNS